MCLHQPVIKPLHPLGSAFVTFLFLIGFLSVPLLTDLKTGVRFDQMPMSQHNCVRLTVDALKLRYGRSLKARGRAPSDKTIARYVRSCRNADRLAELYQELELITYWFSHPIPLHVLLARPYNRRSDFKPVRTTVRNFRFSGPDRSDFLEEADRHRCPDTITITFCPDTIQLDL